MPLRRKPPSHKVSVSRSVLTLEVEYSVPIPVLGKLAEHIVLRRNEGEFQLALENVKETLEA